MSVYNIKESDCIWCSREDLESELDMLYSYNPDLKHYDDKLKKYKTLLERDYKGIASSDEHKKKIMDKITNIPYEMIEADKFDFEEIECMIDKDVWEELGYNIDYVSDMLYEEYIKFFEAEHWQLVLYYDYIGYIYY